MPGEGPSSVSLNLQRSLDGLTEFQVEHHLLQGMVFQMMRTLPVHPHILLLSCQGLLVTLIGTDLILMVDLMEMVDHLMVTLEVDTAQLQSGGMVIKGEILTLMLLLDKASLKLTLTTNCISK